MTQFNPQNKAVLTYGECLDPIALITDKDDAMQYKQAYINYIQKAIDSGEIKGKQTAEEIAKHNIGYYANYFSVEKRDQVYALFGFSHPFVESAIKYQ